MRPVAFLEDRVLFSPGMRPEINRLLQAAVAASRIDRQHADMLFWQARDKDPQCLQTYFALYKFYFYGARLAEAERVAVMALEEAARQGGFPSDWRRLRHGPDRWNPKACEKAKFYLYTLKALAFIKLRQGHSIEANLILAQLKRLDPEDLSGASVVMQLAEALEEQERE